MEIPSSLIWTDQQTARKCPAELLSALLRVEGFGVVHPGSDIDTLCIAPFRPSALKTTAVAKSTPPRPTVLDARPVIRREDFFSTQLGLNVECTGADSTPRSCRFASQLEQHVRD